MKIGPIELEEIVTALRLLGGEAQAKDIKDKVTELRGFGAACPRTMGVYIRIERRFKRKSKIIVHSQITGSH